MIKFYRHPDTHEIAEAPEPLSLEKPWVLIGSVTDLITFTEKLMRTNQALEFQLRQKLTS